MQEDAYIPQQTAEAEEPDLLYYLEIILKHKKMILSVTFAAAIISVTIAFLLPKKYESTVKILPPQQEQGLMAMMLGQMGGGNALGGLAGSLLGAATPADMYATFLDSDDIKDTIIDRFKLMQVYGKTQRVAMYGKMDSIVDIKAGKKDGVITVTVEDEEPKRAAAIAGAYIDELSRLVAQLNVSGSAVNRNFYEGRLAKAKADLARAEENMKAYQSRTKVVDVSEQAKASIEGIAMMQAQLVTQEAQLASMRSTLTDTTPEVSVLKASVVSLKRKIAQMEGTGSGSSIIPAGSLPQAGEDYVRLMREFKTQEALVELLTKQYELAKLGEAQQVSNIQVIQKPHVPDKKVKPKRALIVIAGTFLAGVCSVLWALIGDYLDSLPEDGQRTWRRLKSLLFAW